MNSWRPDGWDADGIIRKRFEQFVAVKINQAYIDIAEAGADAILEALRKGRLTHKNKAGTVVFIPDDTE